MPERFSKGLWFCYIFLHLILVALSASYIDIAEWMPGKDVIDMYAKASGADSSYGFFAPSIGIKTRGVFDVIDENGKKLTDIQLIPESQREPQIRAGGIFDEFTGKEGEDESFRQRLAASLAAAIFSQHASAAEVVLYIQEFWPKSMEEYRQGERADWSDYYAARFTRTAKNNAGVP